MNEIIFNLKNLYKIKVKSSRKLDNKLDFDDIFSTIPCLSIDDGENYDCLIELKFNKSNRSIFKYNKDYTKFIIDCPLETYYIPDVTFLMLCIFASKIQDRGYYLVHSSAMLVDGKGVIFIGPSGSGKTNISLNLAKFHNAKYISGDMTLLKYDESTNKVFLVGGTKKLTAFENIINEIFGEGSSKNLDTINSKKILDEQFLIKHNIEFAKEPCELNLIVNIRGGLKTYIKKDYDLAERTIKVVGMISEWIRTHSNYCISTNDFFPDMDCKENQKIRKKAITEISKIKQFSVYGPYGESADVIYKNLRV